MTKKNLATILMLGLCGNIMLQACQAPEQPIYVKPSFEFRCFIDKFIDNFSVPGLVSIATALLSVYYLHQSISAYTNRRTTHVNQQPISEATMVRRAKDYGISAAALATMTALLYFRAPLKNGLVHILNLFGR